MSVYCDYISAFLNYGVRNKEDQIFRSRISFHFKAKAMHSGLSMSTCTSPIYRTERD